MTHATTTPSTPILDLFRRSGDAELGQTLRRLAQLAAAVQMSQAARLCVEAGDETQEGSGANGLAHSSQTTATPATGRGSARTEVGR